jgi:hypothetical protein
VDRKEIVADGQWQDVRFERPVERSSWMALRVLYSAHTNPIFVLVNGKPIRASRRSAEWCRRGVDRCWEMKRPRIRGEEIKDAEAAYDKARQVYDRIREESRKGSACWIPAQGNHASGSPTSEVFRSFPLLANHEFHLDRSRMMFRS